MSDDEYDHHSSHDEDDNNDDDENEIDVVFDNDEDDGEEEDEGEEDQKQQGGDDGSDNDNDNDDDDDDDDDEDDDEKAQKKQEKELKELNEEAQYMYDECSVEQPAATAAAAAAAATADYSSYFQSNIMSVNDKERDLKSQHVTFKEATLRPATVRRTMPILTKYEKAKIIGVRAQQISMGSPAYLSEEDVRKCGGGGNTMALAQEELRQKRTPLIVRRILDSKMCLLYEDWYIADLIDPFEHL